MNAIPFDTPSEGASFVMVAAALVAVLIVAVVGISHYKRFGYLMGSPEWSFTSSWASTITVVGALLGTALSAGAFAATADAATDPQFLSKAEFAALSLLFGVAAVVAPLVFNAFRVKREINAKPALVGYVWLFLVASFVTIWAVLGQLGSLLLLFLPQLADAGTLSTNAVSAFQIIISVAVILVMIYAARSMDMEILDKSFEHAETMSKTLTSIRGGEPQDARWTML